VVRYGILPIANSKYMAVLGGEQVKKIETDPTMVETKDLKADAAAFDETFDAINIPEKKGRPSTRRRG
jgi:hypothetical protein